MMMMKKIALIAAVLMSVIACTGPNMNTANSKASLLDSITASENYLYNNKETKITQADAIGLINMYEKFANEFPDDSLAPVYLFRASDISMNLQQPVKTIALFNKLMNKYPDYEKTPSVMFLKAFVYEDQLHNLDKAKKYYEEFLAKYPESDFADDAKVSLKNLGKSPEELIQEFEKNNDSVQ